MKNALCRLVVVGIALALATGTAFAAEPKAPAKPAAETRSTTKPATETVAPDTKGAAKKEPVDINTASEAELKTIPGIGDAYAAKIIVNRPYANKAQLKSRNILPGVVYEQVKERIIAKQPKKK